MASKYLSPLLLAGSATATAFQFHGHLNALAANNNAVNAVATTDAGYQACNSVSSVVQSCSAAGSIADDVPAASQAACACCQGQSELDPQYSSCAAYINTALSNPSLASVYGAVYTFCAEYSCGAAAAPSTTQPPTTVAVVTTSRATITSAAVVPAACASVVSIASRCGNGGDEDEILSCLCHDTSGKTNTQVEEWASSCLPWAKSNSPGDVTVVEALESICTAGAGAGAGSSLSAKASTSSSDDDGGLTVTSRPAFGLPTAGSAASDPVASTATQTRIVETEAPAVTSSTSSAAGVMVQQPLGGVTAWVVNGLVAVAGWFVMV